MPVKKKPSKNRSSVRKAAQAKAVVKKIAKRVKSAKGGSKAKVSTARRKAAKAPAARKPKQTRRSKTNHARGPKVLRPVTTVADILGLGNNSHGKPRSAPRVPTKWVKNYRNLLQLRDELRVQSGHLAKDAAESGARHSMHMADSGTDSFDRDFALSLLSAEQESVFEIEDALRRIENGSYGICELTGRPISKERLAAIPWTRYTYESQQQLEKDGTTSRAHFGSLGTLHSLDNRDSDDTEDADTKPPTSKTQQ